MAKIKNVKIIILALVILIMASSSVFATDLKNATYTNSKITVSGTCEVGDQVQIALFNSNKEPIYFATVKVENGVFNSELPASFDFEEGEKFTVKIADYNGTAVSEKTLVATEETPVTTEENKSGEKDNTPKTGNIQYLGISIAILALGIIGTKKVALINR